MTSKRKYEEYIDDDETALAVHAAAHAAAEQAEMFTRKFIKRIVVKQEYVGRVIGKRAENLNQLKQISHVLVDQSSRLQGYSTVIIADDDRTKVDECAAVVENLVASCTGVAADSRKSPHLIEVPENSVRFIVGPGGQVIKKIKEEFGVQVIIAPGTGNRKIIEIFGTSENVAKAKQRVKDILAGVYRPEIAEIQNSVSAQYCKIQHDVLNALLEAASAKHERHILEISDSDATAIYGKRGNLLKQLKKQSLAKIFVDKSEKVGKSLVVITGPPFAASRAVALVRERLRDTVEVLEAPNAETIEQISHTVSSQEASAFTRDWEAYKSSLNQIC